MQAGARPSHRRTPIEPPIHPIDDPVRDPDEDPLPAPLVPVPRAPGTDPAEDRRIEALIELLDDDSPRVWEVVRGELWEAGPRVRRALERAAQSGRPRLRGRARNLLADLERTRVLRRLVTYVARGPIVLEPALFLMARLDRSDLDARPYRRALDAMGEEVRRRAAERRPGLESALALADYLGGELGFVGSQEDYHHPDNIHLHRAIETKSGMPLVLCALYQMVARRAGIECGLVPLPGHVLLRLYADRRSLLIDPYRGGEPRSRRDCLEYLKDCGLAPQPDWFQDADDALMFQRHLMNLTRSLQMRGRKQRAAEVYGIIRILARSRQARLTHVGPTA